MQSNARLRETIKNPELFPEDLLPPETETVVVSGETAEQTLMRTCKRVPGLYGSIHIGKRGEIVRDPDFPIRSLYACKVLNGDLLDDDQRGSFAMKRILVIKLAKKHGLDVVVYRGVRMWEDDIKIGT